MNRAMVEKLSNRIVETQAQVERAKRELVEAYRENAPEEEISAAKGLVQYRLGQQAEQWEMALMLDYGAVTRWVSILLREQRGEGLTEDELTR